jgi:ComEC/Rec2-related protein
MSRLAGSRAGRWASGIWAGFAVAAGVAFAAALPVASLLPVMLIAAACLLICAAVAPRRVLPLGLVSAAIVLGGLRGASAVNPHGPGSLDAHLGVRPVVIVGTVRSADPGAGSTAIVDARHLSDADTDRQVSGGVLVSGPLVPALSPGDQVEIDATGLRPLDRRPGANSAATLERVDVEAMATSPQVFVLVAGGPSPARAIAWAQGQLLTAVNRALQQPAAALVLGVAFGIHETLSADVRTSLQDVGLIHIVVVSGLKVVLIIGLISAVARVFEWSRRRTLLVVLPVVGAYVLISGAGPAAIRSALMAGAALLAATGARRTDPVPMLALAAVLMVGVDPQVVEDPGFQLSFLGTAGIVLLAGPIAARVPGPRLLAEPFAVTVAAQLATVPVMAGTFGVISLAGPVANALVLPLLPAMIVTGGSGAILSTLNPALGWALLQVTGLGTAAIAAVARALVAIPGAAIQVGNWPAAWSIAEGAGVVTALATLAIMTRRTAPLP